MAGKYWLLPVASRPLRDLSAQVKEQFRDIYFDRANFAAGAAQAGRVRELCRLSQSEQLWRDNCADWAGINRSVCVPADLLVHGTGIEARAATDAGK